MALGEITSVDPTSALTGGVLAFIAGMLILAIILSIALYIYMGFAYMAIGRKAKLNSPGLAWIPGIGPLIIAFEASDMPSWPWFLILGIFTGFIHPFLAYAFMIAFGVFAIIWEWKMFEVVKRPGWWSLLRLIPFVGILIHLVLIGIAAWSKD